MTKMKRTPFALFIVLIMVLMLGSVWARQDPIQTQPGSTSLGKPTEIIMKRGASTTLDLRRLPQIPPRKRERPERGDPQIERTAIQKGINPPPDVTTPSVPPINAPAPPPIMNFDGLDFANWGAGHPPDTVGDVGPTYYIQAINTSIGIFRKSDGVRVAAFTFDTFMSQGNFPDCTICSTENFGDPVILYDTFEDRWVITDFAFQLDGSNNVVNPPGAFQVIAVSKTGDPVAGGWNFYSINTVGGLGDYPKLGIWPDGLYMSVNMFGYAAGSPFQGTRVYAFNKAQMYDGQPNAQVVTFNAPTGDFTLLPSNARLQTGTPSPGAPNYFVSTWQFLNALTVYKFHVDWNSISNSTFTGPDVPLAATSWPNANVPNAPSQGGNTLDALGIRAMMQNQYANIGGTESLWTTHTVRRGNTTGFAAPRWYQVNVTGGVVAPNIPQAATWDPDAANVIHRFMPSLAVDRMGDMALGYSTSSSTTKPAIKYAGRLATDPINTLGQTETVLHQGAGTQTGSCGGTCARWGDYSAMTLDPDGCTFWYTNQYYAADGLNYQTRIGSFKFAECTPVGGGGTISGTVTATMGGAPLSGATVQLGARSTTTDGSGFYSFPNLPAGTYPNITASFPGYITATATSIVVTDGGTTTQNFSLATAPTNACLTDTTMADFLMGLSTNVDLTTSPGDIILLDAPNIDQQNTAGTTTGTGFGTPAWTGQTFIAGVTGQIVKADIQLFCNGCGATPPNLTLSVRDTSGGLPTGADLTSTTIPGSTFASGASVLYTATFGVPVTLNSGTQYALVLRPVSAPAGTGYFWIRSSPSTYASGSRVLSANSGGTWSTDTARDYNFKTYMQTGFALSGNLISSNKDSNPLAGLTPIWTTLSWNATVPANTNLQFQAAASNMDFGPFNFVGPDGTAGTFFTTSPASLSQFNGSRYLKYKAFLSTTDNTITPTVNDVTVCYSNVDCSGTMATITPTPAQVCPNSTGNTASGPAGATAYAWSITNGTIVGSTTGQSIIYTAGASGNVGLTLMITAANGCQVSNSVNVPIVTVPTPTITPGGPTTFCAGGSVTLTSSSASGNQWYLNGNPIGGETNQNYVATASGSYTVVVTISGCSSAPSAATIVTVNPTPPTPTITPGGPTTFCQGGSVTLTSSSATGNQWYLNGNPIGGETNQTYVATASGSYTVVVTVNGCPSAPSAATTVTVNPIPATPTITPGGPTTFCTGGSVTLTSSSATGNQWYLNGNPIGGATSQQYVATASGNYTVVVTASGCSSAQSAATTVTVNPVPATPTITPGGPTTFCAGGSVTLTSSSATGNQWYLNGNPIGGATSQQYVATASGSYTVIVTSLGCSSAPSAATVVTVNPTPPTPTITPGGPTTFCPGGSVTLTSSSATGNQWYLNGNPIGGETNQTYIATASGSYTVIVTASGCSSAPSAALTVSANDTTPPTITCPSNLSPSTDPNQCQAVVTYSVPTVSDNCSGVGTPTCSPSSGAIFPKGTTTVNCNVSDANGNSASCSFTITVNDTQLPSLTCPSDILFTTPGGNDPCGTVIYKTPTASDNCPSPAPTVACSPPSGNCFPVGMTTVTCTATDSSNNQKQCTFKITVQNPCAALTCPANITKINDPNQCGAVVTYPAPTPMGTGCGTINCSPASGSFFPKGTTTVTCNTTAGPSCTFTVTVNDTQPPVITCPVNLTAIITTPNANCVVVNYAPVASDNCPGVGVVCSPASGTCFPLGVTTVTCTATDSSGNTATCSFTVSVFDICIQDDSNAGTVLLINSATGAYRFCCNGSVFTGIGKVKIKASVVTFEHNSTTRRVSGRVDRSTFTGTGSIQQPPGTNLCTISDRDIRDNTCICQ